jgi:hypothetical protein
MLVFLLHGWQTAFIQYFAMYFVQFWRFIDLLVAVVNSNILYSCYMM